MALSDIGKEELRFRKTHPLVWAYLVGRFDGEARGCPGALASARSIFLSTARCIDEDRDRDAGTIKGDSQCLALI